MPFGTGCRIRKALITTTVIGLSSVCAAGCSDSGSGQSDRVGLVVEISSERAHYTASEPVVLTIVLTNNTSTACTVSSVPAGSIVVTSFARDDEPILPDQGIRNYDNGFEASVKSSLTRLEPSASLTMRMRSEPSGGAPFDILRTVSMTGDGESIQWLWPLSAPGKYSIQVRSVPPVLPHPVTGVCEASGEPVGTVFEVAGT